MDGAAAEAIRKLQATLDALKKQRLEDRKGMAQLAAKVEDFTNTLRQHDTKQKWVHDQAKRIKEVEGQVRE